MKTATILLVGAIALPLCADEGMWLYNQFPKDAVSKKYKFDVTDDFLKNLQQASVRIGSGSGSFVSANGLLVTNQHIVANCLAQMGSAGHDYVKDGFYAATQTAEVKCPGLEAGILVSTEDVTKQVKAGTKDGSTAPQAVQARNASTARIEKECADKSGNRCMVVKLFSGVRYDLYQFKPYTDLRIVFAPEKQIAFFGAERDSITYLRYGMDLAFVRAYENGKPAATPHFLKWNADGAKDGDLVFSAGNPQNTARLSTASQLAFYRETSLPVTLSRLQPDIQALTVFSGKSEENMRAAQATLTEFVMNFKLAAGKLIGLKDDRLDARKKSFEQKIRKAVEADAKLGADAGKVWDEVSMAYKEWAPSEKAYQILEETPAPGSRLFQIARQLVRPAAQRNQKTLESDAPINDALETLMLTQYLTELKNLGEKDAPVKAILGGKTPEQAAEALVKGTKLKDPAERKRLAAAPDAAQKSDDAMIVFARLLDAPAQHLRKKHEDTIEALEVSASEKIAQYRLKLFGNAEYPDASTSPRVEFGVVKGYADRAGVPAPYAATFGGLYYRRNNEGPYQVPQHWVDLKPTLDLITPLNFVSTCDIGGGDYGGPVVNKAGELVGITFDGNLESLPDTYLYSDEQARAVHVAVPGVVQALRQVYNASALLQELGVPTTPPVAAGSGATP